ncbi:hypothetical protein AGLY_016345 [Aphis glycines]|uniref:Uncharacterized protein n=1 Tax=Aphis glycines TaxID=307491 RepID=A0A6G0SYS6_APHGL|nr:hypothetical protein AGLY_016345 [Aphis glycines]
MSMLGELLIGLVNSCCSLGSGVTGGWVARQYASKYSDMCSHASSSWFSSNITSNISGGHWANFSEATICTFRCRRGKELANVGEFKYRFIGVRNKGELLKWRCTKNDCTATIYSGQDKNIVVQSNGQHNHEGNSLNKIQRQVLRENCKRRAEESISMQPLKLIRHELLNNTELTSIVHNDLKTWPASYFELPISAIYDRRRKTLPEIPRSREDIFLQLHSIKTQTDFINLYIIPEDESFVCITSADNLQFMTTKCSDLFADGTFNYAPKYFTQLYTIHGYYLPLVYFFLFEKSKEMYKKIWLFLKELCMKCNETEFILQKLHVDFEKAAHQAASEVFEDLQLISCRIHLGQSWWRKINSDSMLRLAYKKKMMLLEIG